MKNDARSNKIIAGILRAGSIVSVVLVLTGMGLFFIRQGPGAGPAHIEFMGLRQALSGSLALDPAALMTLGIVVLLATPFLRVIGAFLSFLLVEKDWVYALISLGVLAILTATLFIPGFK